MGPCYVNKKAGANNLSGESRVATALFSHWSPAADWACEPEEILDEEGFDKVLPKEQDVARVRLHQLAVLPVSPRQQRSNPVGILDRLLVQLQYKPQCLKTRSRTVA